MVPPLLTMVAEQLALTLFVDEAHGGLYVQVTGMDFPIHVPVGEGVLLYRRADGVIAFARAVAPG